MSENTVTANAARQQLVTLGRLLGQDFTNGEDANFSLLDDKNEYALYFSLLNRVFNLLLGWYQPKEKKGETEVRLEAQFVDKILARMLYTVEALRMKYTYDPTHRLRVDLTASGFPNNLEIDNIKTDMQLRQERLAQLPAMSIIKRALLDHLIASKEDSPELLAKTAERSYLEMLDGDKLMLPFVPGEIITRNTKRTDVRSYVFYWSCYDFGTNLPYIYIMTFDQDADQEPLMCGNRAYKELLEVISSEGSRAPKLGIVALAIDDRLESIHPKIIKRIGLGPLYSPFLMDNLANSADPWQIAWQQLMAKHARRQDDFVLMFTDEVVFSKQQQTSRRGIFSNKVREVFYFPEIDLECYEHQASVVHHYVMLPHYLLQLVSGSPELGSLNFDSLLKVSYNDGGVINAK